MLYSITCPGCRHSQTISADPGRKLTTCPKCNQQFAIDVSLPPTPPPQPLQPSQTPPQPAASPRHVVVAVAAAGVLLLVGCIILTAAIAWWFGGDQRPDITSRPDGKPLWGLEIWNDYGSNPVAADQKYKGKTVRITMRGKVQTDRDGQYFLGQPGVGTWTEANIICRIAARDAKSFATVMENEEVEVIGKCAGMQREPGVNEGYVVIFEGCRLVK
jgi:tRNA_anti-like